MHIDAHLTRRLVDGQFPQWAEQVISPVDVGGWDNTTLRLGEGMLVRLPDAQCYVPQVAKEHRWLPRLAPHLPVPIPEPLAVGKPAYGYPWPWSIYRWIHGEPASRQRVTDLNAFAMGLADVLAALYRIEATDGPLAGAHNHHRGSSLEVYAAQARSSIATLGDQIDGAAATAVLETALGTQWQRTPVWVHGDVSPGNILIADGRLVALIDFGCLGVGDPACDLAMAWTFFDAANRRVFRQRLGLDEATWARGRGWALWNAVFCLAGGPDACPGSTTSHQHTLAEILAA